MSVKLKIAVPGGIYFITITCFKSLPLFNIADSYDALYKWSQYLKRTFSDGYYYGYNGDRFKQKDITLMITSSPLRETRLKNNERVFSMMNNRSHYRLLLN